MKPILYLVRSVPGRHFEALAERFDVRGAPVRAAPRDVLLREARDAEVLVPTYLDRVDAELIDALPRLRHVASYGVGTNHIDLQACERRGILVTNTPGVVTNATADMSFALLLAAARRVVETDRYIREGRWTDVDPSGLLGIEVTGKTLGIVGFGQIGQAVARRAAGFDMKVLYTSPRARGLPGPRRVELDELLAGSDFVSLNCPLTAATRNLVSRERIARMKRGAILVNTARGGVLDHDALAEALASGQLAAAGLDVFPEEPKVPAALLGLPNVVLTPHLGSGTRETRDAISAMVAGEVDRVARGEPPRHRVV